MNITRWNVLSPQKCRELSAVRVVDERKPRSLGAEECQGTMYDPKMGPRYEGDTCGTCGGSFKQCKLGHFGIIELNTHVFVNNYLPHVFRFIRKMCRHCKHRAGPECPLAPGSKCVPYKRVTNPKNGTLVVERDEVWTASETYTNLAQCGFEARPEHFIFENLLVLSNPNRPIHTAKEGGAARVIMRPHRYTEPYTKILKLVKRRDKTREEERKFLDRDLYESVNALLMSSKPGRAGTTQVGTKEEDVSGILSSIVSKRGLIRNNLMGKRVDFSARGVAAGDPTLRVDEFGIPRAWRSKLTIPVRVNAHNLALAQKWIREGEWMTIIKAGSGAQFDSDMISSQHYERMASNLRFGDVVDRFLMDGDPVLVIRQPTLHKGSMMCGRARLHDRHTVEMNVNVTTPYNGDFDGDEFNVFVPRSDTARAEYELLFSVKHQIVNENGKCQIYPIQNAVLGMYRMTLENPDALPRVGRGVVTEARCRERIREIWFDEGPEAAVEAIQEVSDMANAWLDKHGASLGLNEIDCVRLDPIHESDGPELRAEKERVQQIVRNLRDEENYDPRKAFNEASVFINSLDPYDKSLRHMKLSGCKGSSTNELNMALVLGSQYVCDAAPRPFFGTHILPCGLKSGFIPTGYIQGLRPEHTVLHQMSGRYGVYTKSVGVKVSGQRYRDMAQSMENLVASPVGSILDEAGNAVQLVYGEDGLDPKHVRPTGIPAHPVEWYPKEEGEEDVPEFLRTLSDKSEAYFRGMTKAPRGAVRDWMRAVIPYGQSVGIIAAQSIGEPATQELLNKIHSGDKNQKKSNMSRLFKPGRDGVITGRVVPGVPVPPCVQRWHVTKQRPGDTEWTTRYERYEAFPHAEEYMLLWFDRGVDVLEVLRRLPNRRSTHPALDPNDLIEVHVALVDGWTPERVLGLFYGGAKPAVHSVRVQGDSEITCLGDFRTAIHQPWISQAWSDDACAMAQVLGIEAARAMLVKEFSAMFKGKVDVRHVMLMVDAMTYTGEVTSMDFFGFKSGARASVVGKACFQRALEVFVDAAAGGVEESDRKQNVSESVVTGCMSVLGTGGVRLVMDVDKLMEISEGEGEGEEEEEPSAEWISPLSPSFSPALDPSPLPPQWSPVFSPPEHEPKRRRISPDSQLLDNPEERIYEYEDD